MASGEEKSGATDTAKESKQFFVSNNDDSSLESFDKDLAAAIVPDHAQRFENATEHRVLRKIDLYLIPWMWLGYGFIYYDKVYWQRFLSV